MASISNRILIVDDEDDLTWSIERSLKKENEQYDIICVDSGDKALEVLKQISFNLVITDIRMPGADGITLFNYVKKHYPAMKVIIMSAWHSPEIKEMVAQTSGSFFVEKPFDMAELKKIIHKAVQNSSRKYKGCLIDIELKDIIRHNCQNKFNGILNITNGKKKGVIYFRSGEIIHVQVGELIGESAFKDVLNWNDFQYDTFLTDTPVKKTIHSGWKTLLEKFSTQT